MTLKETLLKEALENKIIIKDEKGNCKYNGKCKKCKFYARGGEQ